MCNFILTIFYTLLFDGFFGLFLHNTKTAADVVVVTFCQEGGMDAKKKAKKARQCIRIIIDE